jgi:hypothetical protein
MHTPGKFLHWGAVNTLLFASVQIVFVYGGRFVNSTLLQENTRYGRLERKPEEPNIQG